MKNHFTVHGDTTIIYMQRKDGSIEHCFIDTDDFDLVANFNTTWFLHDNNGNTYARTTVTIDGKIHRLQMHRLILGLDDADIVVDHRDHNGLNNKRDNIRVSDRILNPQNKKGARSDSKTGVRGVTFDKESQKFKAHVSVDGKQKTLGRFSTIDEAEQAVKEARRKYMPFSEE